MNEFELILAILRELNDRVTRLEQDHGLAYDAETDALLHRLEKVVPRRRL